jgi:hypothetical protein
VRLRLAGEEYEGDAVASGDQRSGVTVEVTLDESAGGGQATP